MHQYTRTPSEADETCLFPATPVCLVVCVQKTWGSWWSSRNTYWLGAQRARLHHLAMELQDLELWSWKTKVHDALSEFVCPITLELPIDPVVAEDGKIYERKKIVEWLEEHHTSPCTNQEMGTRLLPANQVKVVIGNMINSGVVTGEMADAWLEKVKDDKMLKDEPLQPRPGQMLTKAELGRLVRPPEGTPKGPCSVIRLNPQVEWVANDQRKAMVLRWKLHVDQ